MELNDNTTYQPYVMGRLFAVLEAIAHAAGANRSENAFAKTGQHPAFNLSDQINKAQIHLREMDATESSKYDSLLREAMGRITDTFPEHLLPEDQGIFQLGVYHERNKLA